MSSARLSALVIGGDEVDRETVSDALAGLVDPVFALPRGLSERFPIVVVVRPEGIPSETLLESVGTETLSMWLVDEPETFAPPPYTRPLALVLARHAPAGVIRRAAEGLLRARTPAGTGERLRPPFVPEDAAFVLARAERRPLPLLIVGEVGTGKRQIARALHDRTWGARGRWIGTSARTLPAALLALRPDDPGGTFFLTELERIDTDSAHLLDECLGHDGLVHCRDGAGPGMRLICASRVPPEDLPVSELIDRLAVLVVHLPPLRDRREELPHLAAALLAELCRRLGEPPLQLSDEANDRLRNQRWAGNLPELEAVLARTLALSVQPRVRIIGAADLRFSHRTPSHPVRGHLHQSPLPSPAEVATQPDGNHDRKNPAEALLAGIIHQVAHELKNPLASVKAFTEGLAAEEDRTERERVARLAGTAVQRMDAVIEDYLSYAQMPSPNPQLTPLNEVLGDPATRLAEALRGRGAVMEVEPTPQTLIAGDPDQLPRAFDAIFAAIAQEIGRNGRVTMSFPKPDCVHLELRSPQPFRFRLADWAAEGTSDGSVLPLRVLMSESLFQRNGASLELDLNHAPAQIRIRLSTALTATRKKGKGHRPGEGNGKAASSHRG